MAASMEPKVVNLDREVASFLEIRQISWEMGLASLMKDGADRREAVRQLSAVWARASMARERRWRPRRRRGGA